MKKMYNKFFTLLVAISFLACSSEDDLVEDWIEVNEPEAPSTGSLDLSNYISVGNSLTAGFADGALYPEAQEASFPNILANQFLSAGGGAFVQPDISSGNGFGGVNGTAAVGKSFIDLEAALAAIAGTGSFAEVIQFTEGSFLNESSNKGANLNNFGVPGAKVTDLVLNGYGAPGVGNPFYQQFASAATASILDDAVSANGSFFTLWIGSNDVLGYAIAGGDENEATITGTADFQTAYGTVLTSLTAGGANGIVLNVPPVTIIPFFQTVTSLSGGVEILPAGSIDANTAAFLNSAMAYGAYNAGLDNLVLAGQISQAEADFRKITFTADVANAPVVTDESLTDLTAFGLENIRQAKAAHYQLGIGDLFPLTALSVVGTLADEDDPNSVYGVGEPVPDKYTFNADEQVAAITAYATFNAVIEGIVAANSNVTLVDVRPLFADIYGLSAEQATALQLGDDAVAAADGQIGIEVGGINLVPLSLSQAELYNSVWSTDGVHPNARGAALIANEVIKSMNATYGSTIPEVNPLDFAPINAPF
ncbi:MAG: SGNH/GDSL hydrolase family protein [Ekhidna sp.]